MIGYTLKLPSSKNVEKNTEKFTEKNTENFFCIFFCKFFRIFFPYFFQNSNKKPTQPIFLHKLARYG